MLSIVLFIVGIIFVVLVLPILQSISDIILSFSQMIISSINVNISKHNAMVQDIQKSLDSNANNLIGFQTSDYMEDEYYENNDGCETEDKIKQKVGFVR